MKNLDQYILESLKGYKPGTLKSKEQLPENCSKYFYKKKVSVDEIENLDTSNVMDMSSMFNRTIFNSDSLDLSDWDVSNVKFTTNMFCYCNTIKYLDLSNWNTQSLTTMYGIFYYCKNLEYLNLSNWDTSNIKSAQRMFNGCTSLTNIIFGPNWFKSENMTELYLMSCYSLSEETYESMLTMYDRKKAGLKPCEITLPQSGNDYNMPDGWVEKMEERGYSVDM